MASFASSSSLRYFLQGNVGPSSDDPPFQFLEVRLGLISTEAPSSAPMPVANAVFPLYLRQFFQHRSPFLFRLYLVRILSSLNLHAAACDSIARKIAAFAAQLAGGNTEVDLHVVAVIDYIQIVVPMGQRQRQSQSRSTEETMIMDEVPAGIRGRGAPEPELEEVELGEEEEELGDCSICLDELNTDGHGGSGKKKKVVKIRCGHVYHESCILTWLSSKNSCPLCRMPVIV